MSEESENRRRSRLRWITLGEAVAVAAVIISGLGLWNSYEDRRDARAEKAVEASRAATPAPLVLKATASADGSRIELSPVASDQVIQGQTIAFPSALGLSPVGTTGDARIDRSWFDTALLHARKAAGLKPETAGDARLPVMITTQYLAGSTSHEERAVYMLGYATDHSFFGGTRILLRGLSRVGRVHDDAAGQKRMDALAGLTPKGD